ncbi:MAG TPA: hypothetical protein VGJ01_08460 [Pseudolabrys sp.]|jgi:hypothetical protein
MADIISIEKYLDDSGIWALCVALAAKRGTTPMAVLCEQIAELAREHGVDADHLDDDASDHSCLDLH